MRRDRPSSDRPKPPRMQPKQPSKTPKSSDPLDEASKVVKGVFKGAAQVVKEGVQKSVPPHSPNQRLGGERDEQDANEL